MSYGHPASESNEIVTKIYFIAALSAAIIFYWNLYSGSDVDVLSASMISVVASAGLFFFVKYHYFVIDYFLGNGVRKFHPGERIIYPVACVAIPGMCVKGLGYPVDMLSQPNESWALVLLLSDFGNVCKKEFWKISQSEKIHKLEKNMRGSFSKLSIIRSPPVSRLDFILGDIYFFIMAVVMSYFIVSLS